MVVHSCPFAPTYCRESSQIGQRSGSVADAGYATPHVAQIQVVVVIHRMLHASGVGRAASSVSMDAAAFGAKFQAHLRATDPDAPHRASSLP